MRAYINLQNPIRRASPFKVQNKMFLPSGDHSTKANCVFNLKGWRCFFALGSSRSCCFFHMSSSLRETNILSTKKKVTWWTLLHWVSVSLRSRPPFPITCIDANRRNKTMWQAQKQTQGDSKASETWVCHTHIKPYSYIWWFPKKGVPPQIIHFSRVFQLTDRFSLHTFARRLCQRSLHHLHRWCKSWKVKTLRTGNFRQGNISDSSLMDPNGRVPGPKPAGLECASVSS